MPPFVMVVVGFCSMFLLLRWSFPYLAPFFFGLCLAMIMDVPVSFLESRGLPRTITSLFFALLAFLTLPVVLTLFVLRFWEEAQGLFYFLDLFSNSTVIYLKQLAQLLELLPLLDGGLGLQTIGRWALAIPDLFLIWTITAVSAYFFCRDKRALTRFLARQLPRPKGFSPRQVYRDTSGALWRFIQAQLVLMLISTSVSTISFIALELPYALLSGFLVGFCDLIPVLGPGLVYFVLALMQLWLGNSFAALALCISYLILLLLRQWAEPYFISERLGLHPLAALIALYAGFRFWGPLGAAIGPMLLVFLNALIPHDWSH